MENSDTKTVEKTIILDSEKLDVPINEYYQLILNEYNNERNRKQSIETRSSIVLTLIAALFAFAFDKMKFSNVFILFDKPLTFLMLIKILSALFFFIAFFAAILFSLLSVKTRQYEFYAVNTITTEKILGPKIPTLGQIILDFVEAIEKNRNKNNIKAKFFDFAMISIVICIICLCIYSNLE